MKTKISLFYFLAFLVSAHGICMEPARPLTRSKLSGSLASRDKDGRTPLHHAVHIMDMLQRLVELGAPLDAQDNEGNAALHLAVTQKKQQVVEYLLSQKATVNILNNGGLSPLCLAARFCDQKDEIIKMLVDAGAHVNIQEPVTGLTPLHMVYKQKKRRIPNLHKAIDALLDAGARIDIQDATGRIPSEDLFAEMSREFKSIVERNEVKMTRLRLRQGIKCDSTSLSIAQKYNWAEMTCLLLDYGAMPTKDSFRNGEKATTKLLITHMPRWLIKEHWQRTAMALLCCKSNKFPRDIRKIIIYHATKYAIIDAMTARALQFCAYAQENYIKGVYGFDNMDSAYLDDKVDQYIPQWIEQINKAAQTNRAKE